MPIPWEEDFLVIGLDSIRYLIHRVYARLKRNKAIRKTHGFHVLILDGHEHTSSYLRCCPGCLRRRIHSRQEELFLEHGKHVIAVLKDERRDLIEDAKGLFQYEEPQVQIEGKTKRLTWDIEGFTSWESLGRKVRVVRSLEKRTVCRQRTGKEKLETS